MTTEHDATILARAARIGGYAPSIHNTQPWRWRILGSTLELIAQRERQLEVTDPVGRLLTISCGAALHHVRLSLEAEGWPPHVERLPDPLGPDLLARITLTDQMSPPPETTRLAQAIRIRHTDRRPVPDVAIDPTQLAELRDICEAEGSRLHLLAAEDIVELAAAAAHAQYLEATDPAWRDELAYWAGGERAEGTGVPSDAIPAESPHTTVPGRDFGRPGTLSISAGHDRYARYAILHADGDLAVNWLRGGEALSALWLAATEKALTVVPMSAAIEVPRTRRALRGMLADLGEPLLVLRFGAGDPERAGPPHTPRLPADQVVEILR
jgi:nitroreductase